MADTDRTDPSRPEPLPDDLAQLCKDHPDWAIGCVWTTVSSGPDRCRYWASKGAVTLSAWSIQSLIRDIQRKEAERRS
jgi:hypothetical protein